MSYNKNDTQTSSVVFDRAMHDYILLQAGKYGQTISAHINAILYYLEKLPKKDIDQIIEKGLTLRNKSKWQN